MRRTVATIALITAATLCSGCASFPQASLPGLSSSGGNASADSNSPLSNSPLDAPPIILIPGSHYSAFTTIDVNNWPPERKFIRQPAAAQKHRTPRAQPPPHHFMVKPVASGRLTSGHGYRLSPLSAKPRKHNGIDYAAARGTKVYAAGDGIVVRMYRSDSYGYYIRIRHADGYSTAYAHLNNFAKKLTVGTLVKKGQTIAAVGSTGRSTGNHLHFELIHKGRFVDPLSTHANAKAKTKLAATASPLNTNAVVQN